MTGKRGKHPAKVAEGMGGEVVLYKAADGGPALDVRLDRDTVWLDAHQMATLFGRDRSVIVRHVRNVYKTKELEPASTRAKNAQVAADGKLWQMDFYNLDMIIAVGYRVNSKRGTQFRIWATKVLRDHLVQGYTVHERRLKELNCAVRLIADVAGRRELSSNEAAALLHVVADYGYALEVLDDYDHQRVQLGNVSRGPARALTAEEARRVISQMRERFGGSALFGREKDAGLEGSLAAIMQTAGGREVYPSLEEKASNLLYFLVKNHHFVDGNKRIADNALVAMTLLIAESRPEEKDVLVRVVVNLINKRNS